METRSHLPSIRPSAADYADHHAYNVHPSQPPHSSEVFQGAPHPASPPSTNHQRYSHPRSPFSTSPAPVPPALYQQLPPTRYASPPPSLPSPSTRATALPPLSYGPTNYNSHSNVLNHSRYQAIGRDGNKFDANSYGTNCSTLHDSPSLNPSPPPGPALIRILPRAPHPTACFRKACETCKTDHDGSFGAGRFCSSRCARTVGGLAHRKKRLAERGISTQGHPPSSIAKPAPRGRPSVTAVTAASASAPSVAGDPIPSCSSMPRPHPLPHRAHEHENNMALSLQNTQEQRHHMPAHPGRGQYVRPQIAVPPAIGGAPSVYEPIPYTRKYFPAASANDVNSSIASSVTAAPVAGVLPSSPITPTASETSRGNSSNMALSALLNPSTWGWEPEYFYEGD